jgi:hypothetical protein
MKNKISRIIEHFNKLLIKLDICYQILNYSESERFLQYLVNRIPRDMDPFYIEDEYLLNTLRIKDERLEEQNK